LENSEETPANAVPLDSVSRIHTKQRGELAELAFMFKAVSMGFGVSKPWGDSERYDFILNAGRVLWRVQIKSIFTRRHCQIRSSGRSGIPYTADEIDFLVVYIGFRDLWYVFPITAVQHGYLYLNTDARQSRHEKYREAWGFSVKRRELCQRSSVGTAALSCPSSAARPFLSPSGGRCG
jgi:hypothetical protein